MPKSTKGGRPARKPAKAPARKRKQPARPASAKPAARKKAAAAEPKAAAKPQRKSPTATEVGGDKLKGRDVGGRFAPGNDIWQRRAEAGGYPRMFADGDELWAACVEYFEWVKANPLYETQLVTFQGMASHEPVAKMRPMTVKELCFFLRISNRTWNEWKQDRPDLLPTITDVESVIYGWKFSGAAAGLLNANLIARELGLADKTEVGGKDGGPVKYEDVTPKAPPEDHLKALSAQFLSGLARFNPEALAEASGPHANGHANGNGAEHP